MASHAEVKQDLMVYVKYDLADLRPATPVREGTEAAGHYETLSQGRAPYAAPVPSCTAKAFSQLTKHQKQAQRRQGEGKNEHRPVQVEVGAKQWRHVLSEVKLAQPLRESYFA